MYVYTTSTILSDISVIAQPITRLNNGNSFMSKMQPKENYYIWGKNQCTKKIFAWMKYTLTEKVIHRKKCTYLYFMKKIYMW